MLMYVQIVYGFLPEINLFVICKKYILKHTLVEILTPHPALDGLT